MWKFFNHEKKQHLSNEYLAQLLCRRTTEIADVKQYKDLTLKSRNPNRPNMDRLIIAEKKLLKTLKILATDPRQSLDFEILTLEEDINKHTNTPCFTISMDVP